VALDDLDDLFPRGATIVEWAPTSASRGRSFTRPAPTRNPSRRRPRLPLRRARRRGLSSSAAIEGATAVALNDVWGLDQSRVTLAKVGRRAENEAVGAHTGSWTRWRHSSAAPTPDVPRLPDAGCRGHRARFASAGLELVVIDTKVHAHSTGGYGERRAACERGARSWAFRRCATSPSPICRAEADGRPHLPPHAPRRDRGSARARHRRDAPRRGPRAIGALDASHASMRDDSRSRFPNSTSRSHRAPPVRSGRG
jgi:galactokinase